MNIKRKTIVNSVEFSGVGIHTGFNSKIKLTPNNGEGIVFINKNNFFKADFNKVDASQRSSNLVFEKFKVKTVEHLLAAFWVTGVSDVNIEVENEEIPFFDGSCYLFCYEILKAGLKELDLKYEISNIKEPVIIKDNLSEILYFPRYKELSLNITVVLDYKAENFTELYTIDLYNKNELYNISKARTFAFESWIEGLRQNGLIKGGSLDNALVINSKGKAVNKDGFRFSKECSKHKVIDFIGDVKLYPKLLTGRIIIFYPGHKINNLFLKELQSIEF